MSSSGLSFPSHIDTVRSRASTARGRSAPAGPRSPLRHRPRSQGPPPAVRPGPGPQGLVNRHIRERRGWTEHRKTTAAGGGPSSADGPTCRQHRRARKRATPAPGRVHLARQLPVRPAEPRLSRSSMEEWSSTTQRSTTGTSLGLGAVGLSGRQLG
jgi:hypothetical protein